MMMLSISELVPSSVGKTPLEALNCKETHNVAVLALIALHSPLLGAHDKICMRASYLNMGRPCNNDHQRA